MRCGSFIGTQMSPVHTANLVTNSDNTIYGVASIEAAAPRKWVRAWYTLSRMKIYEVGAAPTGDAPNIFEWSTSLLHTKVRRISRGLTVGWDRGMLIAYIVQMTYPKLSWRCSVVSWVQQVIREPGAPGKFHRKKGNFGWFYQPNDQPPHIQELKTGLTSVWMRQTKSRDWVTFFFFFFFLGGGGGGGGDR